MRLRKSVPAAWLEVTISEGRNRQVRRMAEAVGHRVLRLKRERFGPLTLSDMHPGACRQLSDREVAALTQALGRAETEKGKIRYLYIFCTSRIQRKNVEYRECGEGWRIRKVRP